MKNFLKFFLIVCTLLSILTGCAKLAVMMTPAKKPVASHSQIATQAEQQFWETLHQGDYEGILPVEKLLTAAYLENPNDPKLAAHLGFVHIWQIAERQRLDTIDPLIVDQAILANKYFSDAVQLDPSDARYLGFLGASNLVEGQIFQDERQQVRGYFILKDAIRAWPQFNYFTAGYVMSGLPADSKHYQQALKWEWRNLDVCANQRVDRANPDFSPYMRLETQQGPQRACWNSWIAPHNFEGFFLNMGDMLVKNGDWQTAIKIYNNARLAKNYASWPYRHVLENRIVNAKQNVEIFNQTLPPNEKTKNPMIMFNSKFSCSACHQEK